MIQGSQEWNDARRGKVTASRTPDVVAKTKSGPAASRANLMAQLIAERLTDVTVESYTNASMQWGIENEPAGRAAYAFMTENEVVEVGFIEHPTIAMAGASPDGFVGGDGLVEIKCPMTATHIDTLLGTPIDGKYITQMQFQMACTGRKWCDFVSFDPRMPEELQLFIKRVPRDNAAIASLENEVRAFLAELDSKIARLKETLRKAA